MWSGGPPFDSLNAYEVDDPSRHLAHLSPIEPCGEGVSYQFQDVEER